MTGFGALRRVSGRPWIPLVLISWMALWGAFTAAAVEPATDGSEAMVALDSPSDTADATEIDAAFDRGLPLALMLVFLIGLALNLTPCIYPMLAVTVSIFGGQTESRSVRVFGKAVIYVLGIATMYSVLGVAAALTGGLFGGLLQSRIVLVGISVLFLLLALSMFGVYELRLPPGLMNKLGGTQKAGLAGVFLSGLLVGVFAAPCIGPPIIALLALVGQRADPLFGFLVFFVLSLGLGAPYLVLGTFSGLLQKMPRSGEWMIWVKKLLGFVLIGVAAFYLSLAFRPSLVLILVPLTLVIGGLYLGFLEHSAAPGRWFVWLKRIAGTAAVIAGILFFLSGREPSWEWTPYTANRLEAANQPTVVYFSADWCIPCLELDRRTFTDEAVRRELRRFATLKADVTRYDSPESRELREQFAIRGVPTLVFLNAAGNELPNTRKVGFVNVDDMLQHLDEVWHKARTAMPEPVDGLPAEPEESDPSRAMLVADVEWIQPGVSFRLGVLFDIIDDWHVYWKNPGDSGIEPLMDWELPEGFTAGPIQWPHPQRFDDPPFATFGHEDEVLLFREIRVPSDLEAGQTLEFTVDAEWQVCKEICIVQDEIVSLQLDVRDEPPASAQREHFAPAMERLPVTDPDWTFTVAETDGRYRLSVTPPDSLDADLVMRSEFFPKPTGFLRTGPYRWESDGESAHLMLIPEGPVPEDNRLRAVLVLSEKDIGEQPALPRAILVDTALP